MKEEKDYKSFKSEELELEKERLEKDAADHNDTGKFALRLGIGPLIAGILVSCVNLIPGICLIAVFGGVAISGISHIRKGCKSLAELEKLEKELETRPKQLAMEEVLKQTYKPVIENKNAENEDEYDDDCYFLI